MGPLSFYDFYRSGIFMTYIPTKTITISGLSPVESTTLSSPLSSFLSVQTYLVVTKNTFTYVLDLSKILLYTTGLNLSAPVATGLTGILTDLFVTSYSVTNIPVKNQNNYYDNRIRVFNPISYQDYQVSFTSIDTPTVIDDVRQKGFLDDLVITSSEDMSNYLVAVNGVFHRTTLFNGALYVLDGFRTMRLSGRKDVTIVDTTQLGGHSIIPLTTGNVVNSAYQMPAIVNLNQSVSGTTVFAVIDGYFYHLDAGVISFIDDMHLKLKTNRMPLISQFRHNPRTVYYEDVLSPTSTQTSRKYTDVYESAFLNAREVATASLATQAFQYSRLTAYHSFLVVINNPSVFETSIPVSPTGTPQFYEDLSNRTLSGMMSYGCGLCPSYIIWQDPSLRKAVFLSAQDNDIDRAMTNPSPSFIPALVQEIDLGAYNQVRFVDYFSN